MKGTYLLLLHLNRTSSLSIGKLGYLVFKKGWYVYVGSALNGLHQRIQRHLRKEKKLHWHIDFLLNQARIVQVYYRQNVVKEECLIASTFTPKFSSIPGFGCSDCSCTSHLFLGNKEDILHHIKTLNMNMYSGNHKS
jgi:Uri superfamily endonuclease